MMSICFDIGIPSLRQVSDASLSAASSFSLEKLFTTAGLMAWFKSPAPGMIAPTKIMATVIPPLNIFRSRECFSLAWDNSWAMMKVTVSSSYRKTPRVMSILSPSVQALTSWVSRRKTWTAVPSSLLTLAKIAVPRAFTSGSITNVGTVRKHPARSRTMTMMRNFLIALLSQKYANCKGGTL